MMAIRDHDMAAETMGIDIAFFLEPVRLLHHDPRMSHLVRRERVDLEARRPQSLEDRRAGGNVDCSMLSASAALRKLP
jgi:hypothetical protein